MKKYKITGGVNTSDDGEYVIDYTYNLPTDIISIVPPQLYKSEHGNNVYWFGYRFNNGVSSKQRTNFINYIKGIGDKVISNTELQRFIELPLAELDERISLYDIDCFVYPLSGRSELVRKIVQTITRWTSHETAKLNFELVKSVPLDIGFDWDSFEADNGEDPHRYSQMRDYIENILLPAIHNLDYFSLAYSVKPKYRKYITNYLQMSDRDIERFSKLQGDNILIVDDINTSGATLDEILRIINKINSSCNIFIYTLIGN